MEQHVMGGNIKQKGKVGSEPKKLKFHAGGEWIESKTTKYMECFDPSTGDVIALAPQCTPDEVDLAIKAAAEAFPAWASTPPGTRVQVLFRLKALLDEHLDELTHLLAKENGKCWLEAARGRSQGHRGGGICRGNPSTDEGPRADELHHRL